VAKPLTGEEGEGMNKSSELGLDGELELECTWIRLLISEASALEELKVKFQPELFCVFRLPRSDRWLSRLTFSVDKN